MLSFIMIFSVLMLISLLMAGCLYFLDRRVRAAETTRAAVHPSIFEFFTTLYAIFLGFALFTLWSAYINTERNIGKEADALASAYRSSLLLPDSQDFRQVIREYMRLVVEEEWPSMAEGKMSPAAERKFAQILDQLQRQKYWKDRDSEVYFHVAALMEEVSSLRHSRGLSLSGNLYRPIWVIIAFGFFTILFSLYYLHVHQTVALLIFNFLVLFLLLSCIYVIDDINQPFSGTISVSATAFQNILVKMQALP
jgi:hypothetical protein